MKSIVRILMSLAILTMVTMGSVALQSGNPDALAFREAFLAGELSWDDVLERAREEGEVNWFYWGGGEALNTWVDTSVVPGMAQLGITMRSRRITNTRDAVDLALAEASVGRGLGQDASVDAIWMNGENFFTMAQQNLLFGSFADKLPNSKFYFLDPSDPRSGSNLFDFGFPTEGREMPWSASQYICRIDTARLSRADAPSNFEELEAWLTGNPGRFTYIAPPQFHGNTFVQTVLYAHNPDGTKATPFLLDAQELGAEEFARVAKPGFEYLKRIEPLVLGGASGNPIYTEDANTNAALLANGEVDMYCSFGTFAVDNGINDGTLPPTTEAIIFPDGLMIKNKNFIGIPGNAPNPAAALVLANFLSSPESHISKLGPPVGFEMGIDAALLSTEDQEKAAAIAPPLHGVTAAELSDNAVADTNASQVDIIEAVWIAFIQQADEERSFEEIVDDAFAAAFPEE